MLNNPVSMAVRGLLFTFVLAFSIVVAQRPVVAGEGEDLLAKAQAHSGNNDIATSEFRYQLNVTEDPPTKEMIAKRVAEVRQALQAQLRKTENPAARKSFEDAIKNVEQTVEPQLMALAAKTMNHHRLVGDELLTEFAILDKASGKLRTPVIVLQPAHPASKQKTLLKTDGHLIASHTPTYPGSQEPQLIGRIMGLLVEASPFVKVTSVARLEGDPGTDIRVLQCQVDGPRGMAGSVTCHIDAARGYIMPYIQELDAGGNLIREWTCQDYFRAADTDLWFPKVCVYREKSKKDPNALPTVERYEFSPDDVRLNVEIPPERFSVLLDVGEVLLDGKDPTNYTTAEERRLTLADVENVPDIAGLKILRVGDAVPQKKK